MRFHYVQQLDILGRFWDVVLLLVQLEKTCGFTQPDWLIQVLPGTGVFAKLRDENKWRLYGYVLQMLPIVEQQHYHIIIRRTEDLLGDICAYTGVCPNDAFALEPAPLPQPLVAFDMAYIPKNHGGSKMYRFPDAVPPPETDSSTYRLKPDIVKTPREKEQPGMVTEGPDWGVFSEKTVILVHKIYRRPSKPDAKLAAIRRARERRATATTLIHCKSSQVATCCRNTFEFTKLKVLYISEMFYMFLLLNIIFA